MDGKLRDRAGPTPPPIALTSTVLPGFSRPWTV
jgi:hypothetical protein